MPKKGWIYIITNKHKTTLYIGVTSNLPKRILQHKEHFYIKSFSAQYNVEYLVYHEAFDNIVTAIAREKELKKWRREKKEALINSFNPSWEDLYEREVKNW
jgi:putative endonuclease